jgi:hypothetical protein
MKLTKRDIKYIMSEARRIVSEQIQPQQQPVGNSLISAKKRKDDIQSIIKKHELINIEQVGVNNKCFIGFCVREQKWYGICNDNVYGFGVGTELHKNDCGYKYCPIKKARSVWDAKKMAQAYVTEALEIERKDAQEMMR